MRHEEIAVSLIKRIKRLKNGNSRSTDALLKAYFKKDDFSMEDIEKIHNYIFEYSRENNILLDTSKNIVEKSSPNYMSEFVVWNKLIYMTDEEFENVCKKYDLLFGNLNIENKKEVKKKLSEWKKESRKLKSKKALRVKDLDQSPFESPIEEKIPLKNINIIPIGSGSDGNCMYIEIDKRKILVDAGISLKKIEKALNKNGKNIDEIELIFITHGHVDHISSIKSIAKAVNCPIYCSEYTKKDLVNLGIKDDVIKTDFGQVLSDLNVSILFAEHDYIGTFGYVFESGNCKISYLTDNGYTNDATLKSMFGSDVAILEANFDLEKLDKKDTQLSTRVSLNHSSNIRCGYNILALHANGTRNFLLAHISKSNNRYDLALNTIKLMLREEWANIYVCKQESDELLEY